MVAVGFFVRRVCLIAGFWEMTWIRESYAFETLFGSKVEQTHPRKIDADAWFDRQEAERYEMLEHTFPLPNDETLTLLTFTDGEMMEEIDTSWSHRR